MPRTISWRIRCSLSPPYKRADNSRYSAPDSSTTRTSPGHPALVVYSALLGFVGLATPVIEIYGPRDSNK